MELKDQVQGVVIGLFGAYAGGYFADLTAQAEAGDPVALAEGLVNLQTPLLGVNLTNDSTWVDTILSHLGVSSTSAAYDAAAAWANGELDAGASRAEVIIAAVTYLLGDDVEAQYADVAAAFAADVAAGVEWSEGDGAEVLGIADLREEAGNDPDTGAAFNLTTALAELAAANDAVDAYLVDEAAADAAVAADIEANALDAEDPADVRTAIGNVEADAEAAVDGLVAGYAAAATAAQKAALVTAEQASLNAAVVGAQAAVDADQADIDAVDGLQEAIEDYEAAVAAEEAAQEAYDLSAVALTAAQDGFEIKNGGTLSSATVGAITTWSVTVGATTTDLFEIDAADDNAVTVLGGLTDEDFEDLTALVAAQEAELAADAALTDATTAVGTAYTALDLADGGAADGDNTGIDAGDTPLYAALVASEAALETAQGDVTALEDALADLAAISAIVDQLDALDGDVEDAENAIGLAGFDLNDGEGQFDGNGDGDFVDDVDVDFTATTDANENELLTVDFGTGAFVMSSGDVISVTGFTYNDGAAADDGDNSVLEFFVEENGGNLLVTFEEVAFGSNAGTPETVVITLTGLSLEDVVIGNNYITMA